MASKFWEYVISSAANVDRSGDKPLREALILMNNEGVTSLAVVDNQHNVVGNISNADVKVRTRLRYETRNSHVLAPYEVEFRTVTRKHLHTFYFGHPFDSGNDRWSRLLSSLSYQSPFDTSTYSREAGCYESAQASKSSIFSRYAGLSN